MRRILGGRKPRYSDPTYIRYFFYFIDEPWKWIADHNALAKALRCPQITKAEWERQVARPGEEQDFYRELHHHPPVSCLIQVVKDTLIWQVAYSAGRKGKDPKAHWRSALRIPWERAEKAYGISVLFSVNVAVEGERAIRRAAEDLYSTLRALFPAFPPSPAGGEAQGEIGHLSRIEDNAFLLLVPEKSEEIKSANFQCGTFPRLEMQRHKARYYRRIAQQAGELVRQAIDGVLRPVREEPKASLCSSHIGGQGLLSSPAELQRLLHLVEVSLPDLNAMANNVEKARDSYRNLLELEKVQSKGDLWREVLTSLTVAAADARHKALEIEERKKVLERALSSFPTRPHAIAWDAFAPLFPSDHPLLQRLMEKKALWQQVIEKLWDFSKVREMVLHEWRHVEHVYRLSATLVQELQNAKLLDPHLNPAELYILAAAALLHDVGLSGGKAEKAEDENGDPIPIGSYYNMRRLHGLIAYHELRHELGDLFGLPAWAKPRVAALSLYHVRQAPLYGQDPWEIEIEEEGQRHRFKVPPLEETKRVYVPEDGGSDVPVRMCLLAAILRLADALDVDLDRTGDWVHHPVIRTKVQDEIDHALCRVQNLGIRVEGSLIPAIHDTWGHSDPTQLREQVESMQSQVADNKEAKSALEYLAHLCAQPLHFRKHQCFEEVQVAIEQQSGSKVLAARYPKVAGCDDELARKGLELICCDLKEEFAVIQKISPFDQIQLRMELKQ